MRRTILFFLACIQCACTGVPNDIQPIRNFQLNKYLGKWYEIARLDHSFERGLSQVTANYSLREDGGINVINSGFSEDKQDWQTAEGKAYFVDDPETGHLKVSFFGPFYGSYVIFEVDQTGYQYAYITSYNKEYLWMLARTPVVKNEIINDFLRTAKAKGFDLEGLIFVEQAIPDIVKTNYQNNLYVFN